MPESVSPHDHRRTVRISAQTQVYKPPQLTETPAEVNGHSPPHFTVLTSALLHPFLGAGWPFLLLKTTFFFHKNKMSVWSDSGLDVMWGCLVIGGIAAPLVVSWVFE